MAPSMASGVALSGNGAAAPDMCLPTSSPAPRDGFAPPGSFAPPPAPPPVSLHCSSTHAEGPLQKAGDLVCEKVAPAYTCFLPLSMQHLVLRTPSPPEQCRAQTSSTDGTPCLCRSLRRSSGRQAMRAQPRVLEQPPATGAGRNAKQGSSTHGNVPGSRAAGDDIEDRSFVWKSHGAKNIWDSSTAYAH